MLPTDPPFHDCEWFNARAKAMGTVMAERADETGCCTIHDLIEAGFSVEEIRRLAPDAALHAGCHFNPDLDLSGLPHEAAAPGVPVDVAKRGENALELAALAFFLSVGIVATGLGSFVGS